MTVNARTRVAILTARAVAVIMILTTTLTLSADPARAEGGGTSSSSVVGRGDILTTITSMVSRSKKPTGSKIRPRCRTVKLNDAEIEFLIALVSLHPDTEGSREFSQILRTYLIPPTNDITDQAPPLAPEDVPGDDGSAPTTTGVPAPVEYDVVLRVCDGVATEIWAAPRPDAGDNSLMTIGRRMITRLPEPLPMQTPPLTAAVPVNQPVFVSIPPQLWTPVQATLMFAGTAAEVRAEPVSLRVYTGDGSGLIKLCPGRGTPFDFTSRLSPARQSANPAACTVSYSRASDRRTASDTADISGADNSDGFIGAVTVIWSAEWRNGSGPWRSLGLIPRTKVFERTTREVRTAISTATTGRHSK